jgi:hypothetical protein
MHGRMQLITGLNTALLPALGALAVAAGRNDVGHGWLVLFPVAGVLLSIIGYVAGANDRHLVVLYRKQLAWTAESLLLSNGVADSKVYDTWVHAGRAPNDVEDIIKQGSGGDGHGDESIAKEHVATPWRVRLKSWWDSLTSWRWDPVSVTRLPALLSLVFIVVWLVVLVLLLR